MINIFKNENYANSVGRIIYRGSPELPGGKELAPDASVGVVMYHKDFGHGVHIPLSETSFDEDYFLGL